MIFSGRCRAAHWTRCWLQCITCTVITVYHRMYNDCTKVGVKHSSAVGNFSFNVFKAFFTASAWSQLYRQSWWNWWKRTEPGATFEHFKLCNFLEWRRKRCFLRWYHTRCCFVIQVTRCSAIAERPRCSVRYSFR